MKYDANNNGNLIYYDSILHKSVICEPTMLFLLGLDRAINKSDDTHLVFPKEVFLNNLDEYNKIKDYLLNLNKSSVVMDDEFVTYQCNDIKRFLKSITTKTDGIPVIKRSSDRDISVSLTYKEIFWPQFNKDFYKEVDYQVLYSYALGILFGYSIMEYGDVWRIDPTKWENSNLLSEAVSIFRFHYCSSIKLIDCDPRLKYKYKGIQLNKIWNFTNIELLKYPDGYSMLTYYNLESPVLLLINDSDGSIYNDSLSIIDHGYTLTPSESLDAYIEDNNNNLQSYNLRYNKSEGYWSSSWEPRRWSIEKPSNVFIKGSTTELYTGDKLFEKLLLYTLLEDDSKYVFNNSDKLSEFDSGLVKISNLYDKGITNYSCTIIEKDDYGNPLTNNDGDYVVWYDANNKLYWNGYSKEWQQYKPSKNSKKVYDASTHESITVDNITDREEIKYPDGTTISYSDFYSNMNYGLIVETLSVIDQTSSNAAIVDCYHDTYIHNGFDRYCIPNVTNTWVTRSEISAIGYRFVNGVNNLYLSNIEINLVYDADPVD